VNRRRVSAILAIPEFQRGLKFPNRGIARIRGKSFYSRIQASIQKWSNTTPTRSALSPSRIALTIIASESVIAEYTKSQMPHSMTSSRSTFAIQEPQSRQRLLLIAKIIAWLKMNC
jgi:hypothetical protein